MNRTALALTLCGLASCLLGTAAPALADADERPMALHDAARDGDVAEVRKLLDAGVPVDAGNHYGVTALFYAAGWGHADVVRLLLERGADLAHRDNLYNYDAMSWAVRRGHTDVMVLLVEHGADSGAALFAALSNENAAAVRALAATGKVSSVVLDAALSKATLDGEEEMAAVLAAAGGKLPEPSTYEMAPELLARYAGTYAFERFPEYKIELTLTDGGLIANFPDEEPVPLEALDDVRFRQPRSTFIDVRMVVEGETVKGVRVGRADSAEPFFFVREDAAPAAPDVAPAAPETSAKADAAPQKEVPTPPPLAVPKGVAGRNWTGFRGPGTAGTAQGNPPLTWNVEDGTHILWKTPIPGRGHASPIVWGERVFIATAVYGAEEGPFRTGLYGDPDYVEAEAPYSWRLLALDRGSGKVVWDEALHEGKPRAKHHIKATQMNATPVTDGRHLVAVAGSEGLFCFDLDGKRLWRADLGTLNVGWFYDAGYEWGHSSSPILDGERVIVQVDRSRDPYIAAYALVDGRELWRTPRENIPSWGTPALLAGPQGMEIVTNGSRKIRGYDAASGRELWSLGPHSEVTVGSVVTGHGLAFAVGNWAPVRAIYAIRPGGVGDISLAEGEESNDYVAWRHTRGGTYVPTPLVYGEHLYTLASSGILTAYEARTGKRVYRDRVAGRGGIAFSASPVAAAGRLYIASEDGDVFVVAYGRELELLAENAMNEVIMATPAISGDLLIVRTLGNVYAIGSLPQPDGATVRPTQE